MKTFITLASLTLFSALAQAGSTEYVISSTCTHQNGSSSFEVLVPEANSYDAIKLGIAGMLREESKTTKATVTQVSKEGEAVTFSLEDGRSLEVNQTGLTPTKLEDENYDCSNL